MYDLFLLFFRKNLDNRYKAIKVSHSNSISAVAQKFHPCLILPQQKIKDGNLIQNCHNYPTFPQKQRQRRKELSFDFILNKICFCCFSESIWIIEIMEAVAGNILADQKISNDLLHHQPFKMRRKIPLSRGDFCPLGKDINE